MLISSFKSQAVLAEARVWISITFLPISRKISWRHLSAAFRSRHSVARYGRRSLSPPRRAFCLSAMNLLNMFCGEREERRDERDCRGQCALEAAKKT